MLNVALLLMYTHGYRYRDMVSFSYAVVLTVDALCIKKIESNNEMNKQYYPVWSMIR